MEDGEAIYESPTQGMFLESSLSWFGLDARMYQGLRKIQEKKEKEKEMTLLATTFLKKPLTTSDWRLSQTTFRLNLASIKGTIRLETGPPITYDSPSRVLSA